MEAGGHNAKGPVFLVGEVTLLVVLAAIAHTSGSSALAIFPWCVVIDKYHGTSCRNKCRMLASSC